MKASWIDSDVSPGDLAKLHIKASPNSICSISSSDKTLSFIDNNWKPLNLQTLLSPYVQEKVPKANYKLCQPHGKRRLAGYYN